MPVMMTALDAELSLTCAGAAGWSVACPATAVPPD
jgi:hypothetical protein